MRDMWDMRDVTSDSISYLKNFLIIPYGVQPTNRCCCYWQWQHQIDVYLVEKAKACCFSGINVNQQENTVRFRIFKSDDGFKTYICTTCIAIYNSSRWILPSKSSIRRSTSNCVSEGTAGIVDTPGLSNSLRKDDDTHQTLIMNSSSKRSSQVLFWTLHMIDYINLTWSHPTTSELDFSIRLFPKKLILSSFRLRSQNH